jgi:diguanylate cyclase (GGDEF)-like protein
MTSFRGPPILRVLTIDDNPAIHEDFKKILSRDTNADTALAAEEALLLGDVLPQTEDSHFELYSALQGEAGVELARQAQVEGRPFAVAFIDMRMPPGWDGLKTIEQLWKVDPDVQVVICSAYTEYGWSELRSRLGPSDKLLVLKKPFESIEVLQAASALCRKWHNERMLRRHVEDLEHVIAARTKGLEAANHQLQQLATHDVLTGLPNRVILHDRLEQAIAHASREQHEFAVLLLDLDRFKVINDSLGHGAGDELLKEVALRLKSIVRSLDTLVRLGGDEFVIVMASIQTRDQVPAIATRAIEVLRPPIRLHGVDVRTSASIGIAFYPSDGVSVEMLLAHADSAMYSAKQSGHGTYQCYATATSTSTRDRVKFESELHAALAAGQFELHYQPKVDTASGRVHSAEALIRWRHPEHGLLLPKDFIHIAEECGLLDSIGEWVLGEACRQAKLWQRHSDRPMRVAVNVSPSQFRLGSLVEMVRSALTAAELEPRFLEVELTETAVMSNAEESIYILESLSRLGVLISVDDFGTGYSSMSYLRRFPIDKLKIDRTFVKEMTSRPEDASIVRAMVSLAHSLNLKVVAEGVETGDQLALLQRLGCDQYQGFHFSEALPAKDFERLISTHTHPAQAQEIDPAATQSRLALG